MRLGIGLSICDLRRAGAIDPATLSLQGWWRASFTASPWVGTSSAGSSGSRDLTEATNPPSVGAALNGFTPASFDGTNDQLTTAVVNSTFLSTSAGFILCLFNATSAAADAGAAGYFNNPGLVSDIGGSSSPMLTYSTSGVRLGTFNGSDFNSVAAAASTGAWHVGIGRWDSTTIEVGVDGGPFTTLARTVSLDGAGGMGVGRDDNAALFFNGLIAEVMMAQFRPSDAEVAGLVGYLRSRYAITL